MSANAHRVFFGESKSGSYHNALQIERAKEDNLRSARDEIRETISEGFVNLTSSIAKQNLFETTHNDGLTLRPKFKMQGSFAYRTCNAPEHTPPQEIDLDDGLFLPVSFLSGGGKYRPDLVSDSFFGAVEEMLKPLCNRNGWVLETDKDSCVRIRIADDAHVDLALYAIPDKDFTELQESAMDSISSDLEKAELEKSLKINRIVYNSIPEDHIMLAHRSDGWKPSDPRKLDDWFHENLESFGEQYRRVCRYIKGWRDHTWPESRLSSIALMSAVATTMEELRSNIPTDRDDLAVLAVAEKLPDILNGQIANPVVQDQRFDEGWSETDRKEYVDQAKVFRGFVRDSLATNDPKKAIQNLTDAFGNRIPNDEGLVALVNAPAEVKSDGVGGTLAATALTAGILKSLGDSEEARAAVQKGGDTRYA